MSMCLSNRVDQPEALSVAKISEHLTIIIKTFERFTSLVALLDSIKKWAPQCKIIIADDSETPYASKITSEYSELQIKYLALPFNVGVSRGRNALLNEVTTEYFLLCDDDLIFDRRTRIDTALEMLIEKDLDILGGLYHECKIVEKPYQLLERKLRFWLTGGQSINFIGELLLVDGMLTVKIRQNDFPDFSRVDFCHNFFVARTGAVKDIGGWPDEFKIHGEHIAFFLRAKQAGLKVGFTNRLGVRHCPVRTRHYASFRLGGSQRQLFDHFRLHTVVRSYDNGKSTVERLTPAGLCRDETSVPMTQQDRSA